MFGPCDICGANDWDSVIYKGAVRSGAFGRESINPPKLV
jgi:2-iminoacetate synthase ThiH